MVSSGSRTAYFGSIDGSLMLALWCVAASVMTAATVVSEPVPEVVGTAQKGTIFLCTLSMP